MGVSWEGGQHYGIFSRLCKRDRASTLNKNELNLYQTFIPYWPLNDPINHQGSQIMFAKLFHQIVVC